MLAHPVRLAAWRLQVGQACWLAEDAWPGNLAPITIGPDAWIAARAVLASGTVVRGNPAVVVGER